MIVKYNVEVCTRNLNLAINQISRAYALLISDITEGKKYGFEYQFFRELPSQVEESFLAENDNTNKESVEKDILLLGESSREPKMQFMNSSLLATNPDSYGDINKGLTIMDSQESNAKIFDMQTISENALSIAHIQDTMLIIDNKLSIGEKLDKIIEAANRNSYSYGEKYNHMRVFGRSKDSVVEIMDSKPIATRYHYNISQLDNPYILSERYILRTAYNMTDIHIMDRGTSDAWIDHTYIYGSKNRVNARTLYEIIFGSHYNKKGRIDYTTKMFDGHAGIKGDKHELKEFSKAQSRQVRYTLFSKTADRWGKFARFNDILIYERTQMREIKFIKSLLVDRGGKPDVLLDKNMLFFERAGKFNPIIETNNIFAERFPKSMLLNRVHYMYDKFQRNINIYDEIIYSDRQEKPLFLPDATDVFNYGILPKRNGQVDIDMDLASKELYPYKLVTYMKRAQLPEKISVVRLFHTFEASVVNKVIFALKKNHDSEMFNAMQIVQAVRDRHESIVFVDLKQMDSSEKIALVTDNIIQMLSHDVESVVMVGVTADNSQTQSEFMVGKFTADSKAYIETVLNLMALGWGKCEHATNIDIELIDADNAHVSQSIVEEIMEIATGMNKDRLGEYMKSHKVMEKNKDKLQAIEHGFLVRMHRIPEQKPVEVAKLQSASWDTEWEKLCNIRIESKDIYDKLKVPNDDYDYSQLINQVYNTATGVPFKPKGPMNKPEVEVNLPIVHYNTKYNNLVREEIPVDLYIYKDMMLLIWIFWCKNRSLSENILGTLKDFYETENLEMTMFQEFAKIAQMDAAKAISYVLDKCNDWIQNTISYYDPERMNQYERVMKQVRWFGEKVANELSKYILVREYEPKVYDLTKVLDDNHFYTDSVKLNTANHIVATDVIGRVYMTSHMQTVDGELIVEAIMKGTGRLTIKIEDEIKTAVIEPGIYMEANPSNSAFIKPAIKIELPAGSYNVKMLLEGGVDNCEIVTIKATNNIFKTASMRLEAKPGTGTQAIDRVLSMMYDYYEIHHLDKAKGERSLWVSE